MASRLGEIGSWPVTRIGSASAVLLLAIVACSREGAGVAPTQVAYNPVFVDQKGTLNVFPPDGPTFSMDLPISITGIAYAPDGLSLYGFGLPREGLSGLQRISFSPLRSDVVPGTASFRMVSGVAASPEQDRVVISGRYGIDATGECGLFEVVRRGNIRKVAGSGTCNSSESWVRLSLAPDGKRLLGYKESQLEIIEIESGSIRALGDRYVGGAWSPDGKWIAVLEGTGGDQTVLLDAKTTAVVRRLGSTNLQWSPDSRFLLGERSQSCFPEWGTFVVIDVSTGSETIIPSSHCKVNLNTTGWLDRGIRP
jgi:WD40 repeat protein